MCDLSWRILQEARKAPRAWFIIERSPLFHSRAKILSVHWTICRTIRESYFADKETKSNASQRIWKIRQNFSQRMKTRYTSSVRKQLLFYCQYVQKAKCKTDNKKLKYINPEILDQKWRKLFEFITVIFKYYNFNIIIL